MNRDSRYSTSIHTSCSSEADVSPLQRPLLSKSISSFAKQNIYSFEVLKKQNKNVTKTFPWKWKKQLINPIDPF